MDWIVTTARTVEEAQTRALDLLGVDTVDAEIQVIEEGKTGLFGRTKSEARVRARIKPKAPAEKEERRSGRGGDRNRGRSSKGGSAKGGDRQGGNRNPKRRDGGGSSKDEGDGGSRSSKDGGGRSRNKANADSGASAAAAKSGGRGGAKDSKSGSRDGGGRSRNRGGSRDTGGRDGGGRQRNDRDRNSRNNEDRVEMPIDEQRETLEAFVAGVAKSFASEAKTTLVEEGTTLQARVNGGDLGRLVGAKAATLQSLEELARTAMHRAAAGRRYHRIQVDVDDYRARRRDALAKFATDLAHTVAETGESKALEPMGAADRKLIHDAVADVEGVDTTSEGRDPRRHIVLFASNASDEEE